MSEPGGRGEATVAGAARSRAARQLSRRELTTRYLGSVTGFAWALLSPLALLGVYYFVFTHIFRATGFAGPSFLAFVAVRCGRGLLHRKRCSVAPSALQATAA
jgi:hypothetical protein